MAAFQQRLALKLIEVWIVRLCANQVVDLRNRCATIAVAIARDRARVARREAVIAERIAPHDRVWSVEEAGQLGAHHVVTQLQLRRILVIPIGACFRDLLECGDAVGRHRVTLHVRVDVARIEQRLVGEPLEQFKHATRRLAGGVEEFHAGMVSLVFLRSHIGEQRARDGRLRCQDRGSADVA